MKGKISKLEDDPHKKGGVGLRHAPQDPFKNKVVYGSIHLFKNILYDDLLGYEKVVVLNANQ